ncbi:MAG: transglutaminase domain-containing protein, partial [Candidatus Heimdallarchaeota archaeon]|nr:transglutaminase domain-containing protein [Candidatus Heimdallarchaeota archaeon]
SPTYNQTITNLIFQYSPQPSGKEEFTDKRGNKVIKLSWIKPKSAIKTVISFTALNKTVLKQLETKTPFPFSNVSADIKPYLAATKQVPSTNTAIISKARELTNGAKTEFDAVQRILTWVIDHMNYVLTPKEYGAMYSFKTGKGNCQNYSHLSVALLRAAGIPARVVGGLSLKKAWKIPIAGGTITQNNGQGRHAWIEVYYPDLGWIPYDAQQSHLFVNSHYIRQMVGPDASSVSEAMRAAPKLPANSEDLNPDFKKDIVSFTYKDVLPFPDNYVISGVMAESDLLVAGSTYDHHSPIGENTTETPPVIEKPIETTPEVSSIEMPNFTKTVEFGLTDLPVIDIFGGESAISEGDELVS